MGTSSIQKGWCELLYKAESLDWKTTFIQYSLRDFI